MQNKIIIMLVVLLGMTNMGIQAQKSYGSVYGGVSLTHMYQSHVDNTKWRTMAGVFLGGTYEYRFDRNWGIMPSLEFSYINNGAKNPVDNWRWANYYSLSLPIMINCRFGVTESLGLRIGAGGFAQYVLGGRSYYLGSQGNHISVTHGTEFGDRFTLGIKGELGLETLSHWSYFLSGQYSLRKRNMLEDLMELRLGLRYTF